MHLSKSTDGYCQHGTYVGGIGIDWMCGVCEDGWSDKDYMIDRLLMRSEELEMYWMARWSLTRMEFTNTELKWIRYVHESGLESLEETEMRINGSLEDWSATEDEKKFVWDRLHGYWLNKMLAAQRKLPSTGKN